MAALWKAYLEDHLSHPHSCGQKVGKNLSLTDSHKPARRPSTSNVHVDRCVLRFKDHPGRQLHQATEKPWISGEGHAHQNIPVHPKGEPPIRLVFRPFSSIFSQFISSIDSRRSPLPPCPLSQTSVMPFQIPPSSYLYLPPLSTSRFHLPPPCIVRAPDPFITLSA